MPPGYAYSVLVLNRSSLTGDICLHQTIESAPLGSASVAWLTRRAAPRTRIVFQWMTAYAFFWSSSAATLEPGALITASQIWSADLTSTNQITLRYADKVFTFADQTSGAAGVLSIVQDATVPQRLGVAGIAMADHATIVAPMQPNSTLRFDPRPRYWMAFGSFTTGEIIDPKITTGTAVVFPPNVTSMTAIFEADNTWTIAPTADSSRQMAAAARPLILP